MIELEDAHFDPRAWTAEEVARRERAIGHQVRLTVAFRVHGSPVAATDHYFRGGCFWNEAGGAAARSARTSADV